MKPKKVLFVEDDKHTLRISKKWVGEKADDLADFVMSLKQAKSFIDANEYRLLILDFALGDGTAEDIVAYAKSIGKEIPYVVFTAYDESSIIRLIKDRDFIEDCISFIRKDKVAEFRDAVVAYITEQQDEKVFKNIDDKLDQIRSLAYQCKNIIKENT